ncbi:MAG: alpha-1,2-fucosyltransferase [Spirochaetaceae bacterium]|nr:alpha-1,2-fucosyltransferase [Spirochaetaceae bacterium]
MHKTHYYKLYGGIGNQLFQYAHGLAEISSGEKIRFVLNRDFNADTFYDLPELFNVDSQLIFVPKNKPALLAAKVYAKYVSRTWHTGFFQDYEFAQFVKNIEFSKKAEYEVSAAAAFIRGKNAVSVHIRGGDYNRPDVFSDYGNICTEDYYNKAITAVKSEIENPVFVVFSNDFDYAAAVLKNVDISDYVLAGDLMTSEAFNLKNDPAFSMYLQTLCKANIIANSTFSWWSAFLNKTPDKLVISPSKWHNKRPEAIEKLVPAISGWRKL